MQRPHYQVMCTWGLSGAQKMGTEIDVFIWVDALNSDSGEFPHENSFPGENAVVLASLFDAYAVADWVADYQLEQNRRLQVLVVNAGAESHSIEDQLAAGAVIERLAQRGLDAMSPEAAVAHAAYSQLRNATEHLFKASETAAAYSPTDKELTLDKSLGTDSVRVLKK
jgi:2-phosphosulfolactate phosphatase